MFRAITRRPIAAVVLLVAVLAALVLAASARTAPAAKAYSGPVLSTTERGLCIKRGTGEPRSLWLVEATGLCPEPYWGPASLEDAFGITLPKAAPTVAKPAVADDPTEEVAPVLSRNGSPGTSSVPLKWVAANPPAGQTVIGYQVRYRKVTDAAWSPVTSLSNVLTYTATGLTAETSYFFQVRARYSTSTDYGDWSNTLAVATGDLS